MADEIPETIDFADVQAIRTDDSHPLHGAYRSGNAALLEKIEQSYKSHYGSRAIDASGPPQDPVEQEYRQKYGESEPENVDVAARAEYFRQNFDGATEEELGSTVIRVLDRFSMADRQTVEQKYPGLLKEPAILRLLWKMR